MDGRDKPDHDKVGRWPFYRNRKKHGSQLAVCALLLPPRVALFSSSSEDERMLAGRSRPRVTPITDIGSSTPRTLTLIAGPASSRQPAWRATSSDITICRPFSFDSASSRLATLTALPT